MMVCTVLNVGDKAVSWLRHSQPIPQLLALNNLTNTPNPRYRGLVSSGWTEFVLRIRAVRPRDSGLFECQATNRKSCLVLLGLCIKITASTGHFF